MAFIFRMPGLAGLHSALDGGFDPEASQNLVFDATASFSLFSCRPLVPSAETLARY
jgi:hypothetical protein